MIADTEEFIALESRVASLEAKVRELSEPVEMRRFTIKPDVPMFSLSFHSRPTLRLKADRVEVIDGAAMLWVGNSIVAVAPLSDVQSIVQDSVKVESTAEKATCSSGIAATTSPLVSPTNSV